jgi:hypothetical protein
VNVGILGESDLLKMVGIPSLLFLPGFLMLSTFLFLWTRAASGTRADPAFNLPESALISITLSLIAAKTYPWITGAIHHPRDYLQGGYGLQDVFQLWFGSVCLGAIAWIAAAGGVSIQGRIRRERQKVQRASIIPIDTDSPVQILNKMTRNGIKFPLPQVDVLRSGTRNRCFLIFPAVGEPPTTWVAPAIILRRKKDVSPERDSEIERAARDSPAALAKVLQDANDAWESGWSKVGSISGPTSVGREEFERVENAPPRLFVE